MPQTESLSLANPLPLLESIYSMPTDPASASTPDTEAILLDITALLDRFTHFGVELGLERIQRLLANLGNPQQQVPILHVAGSNGKGSVCAYLFSVLTEAGYRVGRYTSPHLVHWCERISLNQQDISPIELYRLLQQVVEVIDPNHPSPTQFEVITAAAWLYFAQQQVDVAVMEVGLGGRLDATNVCDRPLVSLITSLSLEHWQKLGPTLADIAREKAGILKPHCPAVIAPQPDETLPVLQHRLAELDCPAVWIKPAIDLGNGWAEYQSPDGDCFQYPLPLAGAHQRINSAVAIAALQLLQQQGWAITTEQIVRGMAKTQWQGRLQWYQWQDQQILIDGAHNPAGAEMLRHYVDHSDRVQRPISWVVGIIGTKDHADILKALLRPGDRLFLVPVPDHVATDLEAMAQLALDVCPELKQCTTYDDVIPGLEAAKAADSEHSTIVLAGSLYLIGHFFHCTQQVDR